MEHSVDMMLCRLLGDAPDCSALLLLGLAPVVPRWARFAGELSSPGSKLKSVAPTARPPRRTCGSGFHTESEAVFALVPPRVWLVSAWPSWPGDSLPDGRRCRQGTAPRMATPMWTG